MPPEDAEELWTDQDLHNYFYSSGFIRPKRYQGRSGGGGGSGNKPKLNPVLIKHYYKLLGLQPGSKASCVRRNYRQLALKYHPDKNSGSPEATAKFHEITEAYTALCLELEAS